MIRIAEGAENAEKKSDREVACFAGRQFLRGQGRMFSTAIETRHRGFSECRIDDDSATTCALDGVFQSASREV